MKEVIERVELRSILKGLMDEIVPTCVERIYEATGECNLDEHLFFVTSSGYALAEAAYERLVEHYNSGRATKEDISDAMGRTELRHLTWSQIVVDRPPWIEPEAWDRSDVPDPAPNTSDPDY